VDDRIVEDGEYLRCLKPRAGSYIHGFSREIGRIYVAVAKGFFAGIACTDDLTGKTVVKNKASWWRGMNRPTKCKQADLHDAWNGWRTSSA